LDKRAAVVLSIIFGGLFLVLFGFMLLAYLAVKSTAAGVSLDLETTAGARLGVVEAKGTIGEAAPQGVDADKVVKLLKKYEKDDDIKAIVLRVDSPGGAVAPSQEIHDAVKRIKAKKKVVVSMGTLAASGGYYISAPADRIYAEPGTLTGSIGVIFVHFNVRGLLEWARIDETTLKSGKYKELKLVDELGGFEDAVAAAWELAGQSGEPKVQYPPREHELSLRDLMRGAFQGAFQGASEGVRSALPDQGGLMFLAPSLVR